MGIIKVLTWNLSSKFQYQYIYRTWLDCRSIAEAESHKTQFIGIYFGLSSGSDCLSSGMNFLAASGTAFEDLDFDG
jgi:hypothetical protein